MKQIFAASLIAALLLSLCGCSLFGKTETEQAPEPEETQIVNPMEECTSLEELNERTGAKFYRPADANEAEEQYFLIGGETADYRFTAGGTAYVWRFAKQTEMDISGVYTEGGTAFAEHLEETALTFADGDVLAARWCTDEGQYTLCVQGEGDGEVFRALAEEFSLVTQAE